MLRIRQAQIDAFGQTMATQFEAVVYKYLTKTYPEKTTALGEQKVRESIRAGIQRAAQYGITAEFDVGRFIDLMYLISPNFDSDPGAPWVRPTLASPLMKPAVRMDVVCDRLKRARKTPETRH